LNENAENPGIIIGEGENLHYLKIHQSLFSELPIKRNCLCEACIKRRQHKAIRRLNAKQRKEKETWKHRLLILRLMLK